MLMFTLADRWGEPDPRKLAALPANILTYWQAYFDLLQEKGGSPPAETTTPAAALTEGDQQFADCLRILGHG